MVTEGRSTVVGAFEDRGQAERAVDELRRAGFTDDQIGFAARDGGTLPDAEDAETGTRAGEGAVSGMVTGGLIGGLLAAGASLLIPGVGPIIGGGILATVLGGAAAGAAAGGLLGALTGLGVPEEEAQYYDTEFRSGRTIVTVRAGDRYDEAAAILRRHSGYDMATARERTATPVETSTDSQPERARSYAAHPLSAAVADTGTIAGATAAGAGAASLPHRAAPDHAPATTPEHGLRHGTAETGAARAMSGQAEHLDHAPDEVRTADHHGGLEHSDETSHTTPATTPVLEGTAGPLQQQHESASMILGRTDDDAASRAGSAPPPATNEAMPSGAQHQNAGAGRPAAADAITEELPRRAAGMGARDTATHPADNPSHTRGTAAGETVVSAHDMEDRAHDLKDHQPASGATAHNDQGAKGQVEPLTTSGSTTMSERTSMYPPDASARGSQQPGMTGGATSTTGQDMPAGTVGRWPTRADDPITGKYVEGEEHGASGTETHSVASPARSADAATGAGPYVNPDEDLERVGATSGLNRAAAASTPGVGMTPAPSGSAERTAAEGTVHGNADAPAVNTDPADRDANDMHPERGRIPSERRPGGAAS